MDTVKSNKGEGWLLFLGLIAFLANGDNYAAAPLLINIADDLHLTINAAALSVTAYMLSFGVFTLLFGPLSDRFGKARIINIAAIGTSVFSILGAFSFNLPSLIFFRAMNGAFGAGIFPVTMALVGQRFDSQNRQKALGKVMGLMFLGGATATAIGGALAFFGSWRLVYLVYGIGELAVSLVMLKKLERDEPVAAKLDFVAAYKGLFANYRFMRLVITIFFVGFSVFGSFTYTGKLLKDLTGYNVLIVGLILSLFGLGTVVGGRLAPRAKAWLKHGFLVSAAVIGSVSLYAISAFSNVYILGLGLFGFGFAFIFLQTTLVATAQEKAGKARGTAMSMASFNMFVGGAVGTSLNGAIIGSFGASRIFFNASIVILVVGLLAAVFVARFEMRKAQGLFLQM
jgi:predicted MFS family arabinose efflux permease